MDQRDFYIDQLTKLMSVKVVQGDNNQVSIYTGNGIQLVGTQAVTLSFDAHGTLDAESRRGMPIRPNAASVRLH